MTNSKPRLKSYHFGFIFILIILVGCIVLNLQQFKINSTTIIQSLEQWNDGAIVIFLGLYLGLTLIGIPAIPLTVAGGAVFGLFWGTTLSIIGATIGAIATFSLTRSYLKNWVQKRFGHHRSLIRFNRVATQKPLKFVLFVRLVPVVPFNLSNFLCGLTPIGYQPYILGTFLGIIPGTFTYTWLGVTGKQALEQGDHLSIGLSLIIGLMLCLLPLLKRHQS